jgi:hypothetical protein
MQTRLSWNTFIMLHLQRYQITGRPIQPMIHAPLEVTHTRTAHLLKHSRIQTDVTMDRKTSIEIDVGHLATHTPSQDRIQVLRHRSIILLCFWNDPSH